MLVQACTLGRPVSSDIVADILEEYREEITQDRYNVGYRSAQQRRTVRKVREAMDMNRRMARLDAMTVTDKELKDTLNAGPK